MAFYAPDQTFISERSLKALAKELPTPFYLYDERGLRQTARELLGAFSWNPGFMQHFPVRLCPTPEILRLFAAEGCGVFCDTAQELALARQCGFDKARILCSVFPESEGLQVVLDGAFDQPPQPPVHALLRINPGGKLEFDGRVYASLDRVRLGMPVEEAILLARQFRLFGAESVGLSFQALSNELRPEYYAAVSKLLFDTAIRLLHETGAAPEVCCLGDGAGVSYRPEQKAPSFQDCAALVRSQFDEILTPNALGSVRLKTTIGRRMIAPHAIFVTTVRAVKQRRRPLILTDAASGQFAGVGQLTSRHHISVPGKNAPEGRIVCDAAGRQTDAYGYLGEGCILPPVAPGDLLVFHTAGAVRPFSVPSPGFSPAPQYLLREDGSIERLDDSVTAL